MGVRTIEEKEASARIDTRTRPAAGPRGSNQAGVRAHNERAVLSLIRRHGELAKADIARLSGLSPQTASVIIRVLEADGLVVSGTPRRGRVGQPSVPMRLAPRGAFALGLKIGRRTSEMVLTDFSGELLNREAIFYPAPEREAVMAFAAGACERLLAGLLPGERERVVGLGVGMPAELGSWQEAHRPLAADPDGWQEGAIAAELSRRCALPAFVANDVTAACGAEQAFGALPFHDYAYVFVGAFVGGGIVLDGRLAPGRSGNAGALGSLLVPDGRGGFHQLIEESSIHVLERMAREAGTEEVDLWRDDADWDRLGAALDRWIERAASGLAHAGVNALAVYDFEALVIDGSFSDAVRARLVAATAEAYERLDRRGLGSIEVVAGTIGRSAREVGAASLPFFARYFLDHRVLYAGDRDGQRAPE